ncbi:hypothetical protein D3C87_79670 [compost metagenome]
MTNNNLIVDELIDAYVVLESLINPDFNLDIKRTNCGRKNYYSITRNYNGQEVYIAVFSLYDNGISFSIVDYYVPAAKQIFEKYKVFVSQNEKNSIKKDVFVYMTPDKSIEYCKDISFIEEQILFSDYDLTRESFDQNNTESKN